MEMSPGDNLSSNQMKRIENTLSSRERSIKAQKLMKMHKNLDLNDYNKYISYF